MDIDSLIGDTPVSEQIGVAIKNESDKKRVLKDILNKR